MRTFEVSKRASKNGRRRFKAILHEIYPDSAIDTVNKVGTIYNKNGITWQRTYCEDALPTIKDMSIRVEFLDDKRTEECGHGETGVTESGMPVFEDAVMIGHFTKGYIDEIEDADGNMKTVCIGEGYLDEMCYQNYVSKLIESIENNTPPSGSVEIYRTDNNDTIKYLYGYKEYGRIPTEFIYSGYALLGVPPADDSAKLIELNNCNKEEINRMNELEIKSIVSQVVAEMTSHTSEINKCKEECDEKITAANNALEAVVAEKSEIEAESAKIQAALDEARNEIEENYKKISELYSEIEALRKALGEAQARERVGEMNAAIESFTDEEKAYAHSEIDAFNADPMNYEINAVVNKIWEGIGRAAKADADTNAKIAEQNAESTIEDIFSEIKADVSATENYSIF